MPRKSLKRSAWAACAHPDAGTGARTFLSAASTKRSTILVVSQAADHSAAAADRNVRAPSAVAVSRFARAACVLLLVLPVSGCVHYRMASSPRPPAALPQELAAEGAHSRSKAPAVLEWQLETN